MVCKLSQGTTFAPNLRFVEGVNLQELKGNLVRFPNHAKAVPATVSLALCRVVVITTSIVVTAFYVGRLIIIHEPGDLPFI